LQRGKDACLQIVGIHKQAVSFGGHVESVRDGQGRIGELCQRHAFSADRFQVSMWICEGEDIRFHSALLT
jgi:hypothetical protein